MMTSFLNTNFALEKSVIYFENVEEELAEGAFLFRFISNPQIDDEWE